MAYTQIGFTRKTHGVAGEIKVSIEELYEEVFLGADRIFIETRGTKMPFFVQNVRGGGELIAKFEDVNTREAAMIIQSKPIFLPTAEVPASISLAVETLVYQHLVGYMLVDKHSGDVATIDEVIEMPQQEMALLRYRNRDVLIPLNDDYIIDVDKKKKRVLLDLPEGLLDL
jgi:16S rRNA processing protein RimM